jgi:hypothetical protein
MPYLGLDIAAGVLALRRRDGAGWAGAGGSASGMVFCRFVRLDDTVLADSGSGTGLGSRAGVFRFRDGGGGRFDAAGGGGGGAEGPAEDSDEPAALADARVTRELDEDMSTRS